MTGWHFDPLSALIGAAVALALVGLGYSFREPLLRGWEETRAAFRRALGRITAGVEERYREQVIVWAQRAHALAAIGPLDAFFLPPRLLPPPPHPDPGQEEPLAREAIPLGIALKGHPCLLLTGPLASGRTTLLAYLALTHARREAVRSLGLPAERLPIYLHLGDLEEDLQGDGGLNGLERLVQEAIAFVGGPSAARGVVRQHLQGGTALVLVDGWDELSPQAKDRAAEWLTALVGALPGNLWVVATGARGYGPLARAGFVPLRLEGWDRPQVEAFFRRGADVLAAPEAEQPPPAPPRATDLLEKRLKWGPSPLEIALASWLLLTAGEVPETRRELFSQALDRLAGPEMDGVHVAEVAHQALGELARHAYEENRLLFSEEEVKAAVEAALPPSEQRPPRLLSQVLKRLTGPGGPLSPRGKGRYAFSHLLWWAWQVAHQAHLLSPVALVERLDDPRWLPVVDFYAEEGQMEPVVEAWLSRPDDFWRTRLRTAARWVSLAPPNIPWRNGVMALLARTFLTPMLPAEVRNRIGESLVRTSDPGVVLFLQQAMQHPRERVRAAAARAIGLLGERADPSLLARALDDPHEIVRVAAVQALGGVGTPGAIRQLAIALTEGEDSLRIEAARGLALAGEEGWEVLREAVEAEDFLTRRAAAFGLAEVKAPWARPLLERLIREDREWIVRSAASAALAAFEQARPASIAAPPDPSHAGWLIAWAAERGEGVGTGEAAFDALLKALVEGEPPIRRAAVHMLGLVGRPEHAAALRQAVDDPEPEVAQMALWALEELSSRYDLYVQ